MPKQETYARRLLFGAAFDISFILISTTSRTRPRSHCRPASPSRLACQIIETANGAMRTGTGLDVRPNVLSQCSADCSGTIAITVARCKISGSAAKRDVAQMMERRLLRPVSSSSTAPRKSAYVGVSKCG